MLKTEHKIIFANSSSMNCIDTESVDLIVTSPPYPMIEMWDDQFKQQNRDIAQALDNEDGNRAFDLMHAELDKVWSESYRVLKKGGTACINIGDATRTINKNFRLYSNHTIILKSCLEIGFNALPFILWRKQTNAPNKFMGSGMLPSGAYVTLEHEYILIFRKDTMRQFSDPHQMLNRRRSAFFWEERNKWFSDIWDFKGIRQKLNRKGARDRSAAFPFELAYRLINMYSVKNDIILDPFLGIGTTSFAAMASCRNSTGIEIENSFRKPILNQVKNIKDFLNDYIHNRLMNHIEFIKNYQSEKGDIKYKNIHYGFPVITRQEQEILLNYITGVDISDENSIKLNYMVEPLIDFTSL